MGGGLGLSIYDRSMIPNQSFKGFVIDITKQSQIPFQLSQMVGGGTETGRIHLSESGISTVVITIPTKHIHNLVGLLSLEDIESVIRLVI